MKLAGSTTLPARRSAVWALLTDPAKLARLLPGCEELVPEGPDRYRVKVKFGIAAISGNYSGSVELRDQKPPESLHMKVQGKGTPGFMNGAGQITLLEKHGQTEVRYEGEAQVGGLIASVGQRMIEAAAKKIVQQFFAAAAREVESGTG